MGVTRSHHARVGDTTMQQDLIEAISDGVATLTLNRPDRLNALSAPIMDGLLEALPRLAADPAVGAIVLTGAGRAFCAGGDVKRMAEEQRHTTTSPAYYRHQHPSGDGAGAQRRCDRSIVGTPFARQNGNIAAAARNSETHDRDGERRRGRRRHGIGARVRPAHRRAVGAFRHRVCESRAFRHATSAEVVFPDSGSSEPARAPRLVGDAQGARNSISRRRAARRRASPGAGRGQSGRSRCRRASRRRGDGLGIPRANWRAVRALRLPG